MTLGGGSPAVTLFYNMTFSTVQAVKYFMTLSGGSHADVMMMSPVGKKNFEQPLKDISVFFIVFSLLIES